ncbi:hypothetical protein OAP32_00605 [Crocinitomicaceae bacterium]|nr:hypothetical protein [Crocinitomicaceae bacterium]
MPSTNSPTENKKEGAADLICENCGDTGASIEICPYSEDVEGIIVNIQVCQNCYDQLVDDI